MALELLLGLRTIWLCFSNPEFNGSVRLTPNGRVRALAGAPANLQTVTDVAEVDNMRSLMVL